MPRKDLLSSQQVRVQDLLAGLLFASVASGTRSLITVAGTSFLCAGWVVARAVDNRTPRPEAVCGSESTSPPCRIAIGASHRISCRAIIFPVLRYLTSAVPAAQMITSVFVDIPRGIYLLPHLRLHFRLLAPSPVVN